MKLFCGTTLLYCLNFLILFAVAAARDCGEIQCLGSPCPNALATIYSDCTSISGQSNIDPYLTTELNLETLESVQSVLIECYAVSTVQVIDFAALKTITGVLEIQNCYHLEVINLPLLETANGIAIHNNDIVRRVLMPSLVTIIDLLRVQSEYLEEVILDSLVQSGSHPWYQQIQSKQGMLKNVSLPSWTSAHNMEISGFAADGVLSAPKLVEATGQLIFLSPPPSVKFPSLVRVGSININNDPVSGEPAPAVKAAITAIELPLLEETTIVQAVSTFPPIGLYILNVRPVTLRLPRLRSIAGTLAIQSSTIQGLYLDVLESVAAEVTMSYVDGLTELSMPRVASAASFSFMFVEVPELSLPALQSTPVLMIRGCDIVTVSLPALLSVGPTASPNLHIEACPVLTELYVPELIQVSSLFLKDVGLEILDMPKLTYVELVHVETLPELHTVLLPELAVNGEFQTFGSAPKSWHLEGIADPPPPPTGMAFVLCPELVTIFHPKLRALSSYNLADVGLTEVTPALFPLLESITGFGAVMCSHLTHIELAVDSLYMLLIQYNPVLVDVTLPNLASVGNLFWLTTNDALNAITAPHLATTRHVIIWSCPVYRVVHFPELTFAASIQVKASGITVIDLPALDTIGEAGLMIEDCPDLKRMEMPELRQTDGFLNLVNTGLEDRWAYSGLPLLVSVGDAAMPYPPGATDALVLSNPAVCMETNDDFATQLGLSYVSTGEQDEMLCGPVIDETDPAAVLAPGFVVTIKGRHFGSTTDTVSFSPTELGPYAPITVTSWQPKQVIAQLPAGEQAGFITVSRAGYDDSAPYELVTCGADHYSPDGLACLECPAHSSTGGAMGTTRADCVCASGYSPSGALDTEFTCLPCGAGTYKDAAGNVACTACPIHSTNTLTGSITRSACTCDAGYAPDAVLTADFLCIGCAQDSYKMSGGNGPCTACPSGSTTLGATGTDSREDCLCDAGRYSVGPAVTFTCAACPQGTYKATTGPAACTSCPAYSTTVSTGAIARANCVCMEGYTPDADVTTEFSCAECAVNTFKSTTDNSACLSCPVGSTTLGATGVDSRLDCACNPGRYALGPAATFTCEVCAQGTYKPSTLTAACTACPAHSTTASTGATTRASCLCAAGYEPDGDLSGHFECTACAVGHYKAISGSTACVACPTHSTTSAAGASARSECLCEAAYEPDGGGTFQCRACAIGFYKTSSGLSTCAPCPDHSTTASAGSVAREACLCDAGHQPDGDVASTEFQCAACAPDAYRDPAAATVGHSACAACPPQRTTHGRTGATSAADCVALACPAGEYMNVNGTCLPCPANTYGPSSGVTSCLLCPAASTTMNTTGATARSQCICATSFRADNKTDFHCVLEAPAQSPDDLLTTPMPPGSITITATITPGATSDITSLLLQLSNALDVPLSRLQYAVGRQSDGTSVLYLIILPASAGDSSATDALNRLNDAISQGALPLSGVKRCESTSIAKQEEGWTAHYLPLIVMGLLGVFYLLSGVLTWMRDKRSATRVTAFQTEDDHRAFSRDASRSLCARFSLNIMNNHLTVSWLTADRRSTFSHLQRLSAYCSSLLIAMFVCAIFYFANPSTSSSSVVTASIVSGIVTSIYALVLAMAFTRAHAKAESTRSIATFLVMQAINVGAAVGLAYFSTKFYSDTEAQPQEDHDEQEVSRCWALSFLIALLLDAILMQPLVVLLATLLTPVQSIQKYVDAGDQPAEDTHVLVVRVPSAESANIPKI